jgi:hypothetical protein
MVMAIINWVVALIKGVMEEGNLTTMQEVDSMVVGVVVVVVVAVVINYKDYIIMLEVVM